MPEKRPVGILWEGGSCCMSRRVGPTPKSKARMGDSLGNDRGVGGQMSNLGHGYRVGGGMVGIWGG